MIRPARSEDLLPLLALLEGAGLPRDGLDARFPGGYAVSLDERGTVEAAAGVEVHDGDGLLRSVVVAKERRGAGLGTALVRERVAWAGARGLARLWLLTTTAGPLFRKLGFEPADRGAAGPSLAASPEFAHACPASAECLALDLRRARPPQKIVSGGQTGADRGALDAAQELGIERGGWCPRGRKAEDGAIPPEYSELIETRSADYSARTTRNVRESDVTVVLTPGEPGGGSALTLRVAARVGRPSLHLDLSTLDDASAARALRAWLLVTPCATLNVGGSRESQAPGIAALTRRILTAALGDGPG